ncbi:MAG: nucleoside hydrolase [Anaerolineae bacterium]
MTVRVILDCDNTMGKPYREVDDGLTLLFLLGRPDVEILGITTTFGNGNIEEVHGLTAQLLEKVGRPDIPLFRGSGSRGQAPTEAAHFLAETCARYPGEVHLLAIGPLGNLHAASQVAPNFFGNVKQICCMGGYLRPLRLGWRKVPELNLSADPEAAHAVLNSGCAITLMNAHTCMQAAFGWGDLLRVRHWGRDTRRALRQWLVGHALACGLGHFYLWDLLPAVYIVHPDLFDDNPVHVASTVADLETGAIVLGNSDQGGLINMPQHILDVSRFRDVLFTAWRRVSVA